MDQVLMSKKVSMIIPVYQAKKTLERCVSSCISQQGVKKEQLEIILVDDGSTDGSGALCDHFPPASRDDQFLLRDRHLYGQVRYCGQ